MEKHTIIIQYNGVWSCQKRYKEGNEIDAPIC